MIKNKPEMKKKSKKSQQLNNLVEGAKLMGYAFTKSRIADIELQIYELQKEKEKYLKLFKKFIKARDNDKK